MEPTSEFFRNSFRDCRKGASSSPGRYSLTAGKVTPATVSPRSTFLMSSSLTLNDCPSIRPDLGERLGRSPFSAAPRGRGRSGISPSPVRSAAWGSPPAPAAKPWTLFVGYCPVSMRWTTALRPPRTFRLEAGTPCSPAFRHFRRLIQGGNGASSTATNSARFRSTRCSRAGGTPARYPSGDFLTSRLSDSS